MPPRYSNTLLVTFNNRLFIRNVGKWAVSDSYAPGSASQSTRKNLPFSAGLGLTSPTEILTVTYNGNTTESRATNTMVLNNAEESHTLDTLQVCLHHPLAMKISRLTFGLAEICRAACLMRTAAKMTMLDTVEYRLDSQHVPKIYPKPRLEKFVPKGRQIVG